MKVSHLWLNVKDNSVYGMASVLGFKFDDLMLMFQALGLINAGLSLIKPELWAAKLGVDVLWHTFSRCKWCRFPNSTDGDDIIRYSPADASSREEVYFREGADGNNPSGRGVFTSNRDIQAN